MDSFVRQRAGRPRIRSKREGKKRRDKALGEWIKTGEDKAESPGNKRFFQKNEKKQGGPRGCTSDFPNRVLPLPRKTIKHFAISPLLEAPLFVCKNLEEGKI